jgi:large subunit ribosomal protein L15
MALTLHNLQSKAGKRNRKRIGRGSGSGQGTYAGKGLKGQKARAGGSVRAGFEGGRSSLITQTPKRRGKGFRTPHPQSVSVTISALNRFSDGDKITYKSLRASGLFSGKLAKIVDGGKLERKLTIVVPISAGAKKVVESAGGTVVENLKSNAQNTKSKLEKSA